MFLFWKPALHSPFTIYYSLQPFTLNLPLLSMHLLGVSTPVAFSFLTHFSLWLSCHNHSLIMEIILQIRLGGTSWPLNIAWWEPNVRSWHQALHTTCYSPQIFHPLDNFEETRDLVTICRHVGRFKGWHEGLLEISRTWLKYACPLMTAEVAMCPMWTKCLISYP